MEPSTTIVTRSTRGSFGESLRIGRHDSSRTPPSHREHVPLTATTSFSVRNPTAHLITKLSNAENSEGHHRMMQETAAAEYNEIEPAATFTLNGT